MAPKVRPFRFAAMVVVGTGLVFMLAMAAAVLYPVPVLLMEGGQHTGDHTHRPAACLDCHVPFGGSASSRCLSPGCHMELASATPPRSGPAMPARFHAALAGVRCARCHQEHSSDTRITFSHAIIPEERRRGCVACHSAATLPQHARTDEIPCSRCHDDDSFERVQMRHTEVWQHACDLCHLGPDDDTHRRIVGTCRSCHITSGWTDPK